MLLFNLCVFLQIFIMCESRSVDINKSKCDDSTVKVKNETDLTEHVVKQRSIPKIKQLGPIYVDSEEFDDGGILYDNSGEILDTPPLKSIQINDVTENDDFKTIKREVNEIQSNQNSKEEVLVDLKPPKELIEIAEKRIQLEESGKSDEKLEKTTPATSYGVPFSSIVGYPKITPESNSDITVKRSPPGRSYGILDIKSTPYPPYHIPTNSDKKTEKESKTPPATSFGVPDTKINPEIFKRNVQDNPFFNSVRPIGKNLTSYTAPMNWVLDLPIISSDSVTAFNVPEVEIKEKFNARHARSDQDNGAVIKDSKKPDQLKEPTVVDIQRSISSSFDLKGKGLLTKKVN